MLLRRQGVSRQPPLPERSRLRRARQETRIARAFLADLLRACRGDDDDEVDDDAEKILANAGFKRGTRDAPGILAGLPRWLVRFAATCASYAAEEKIALATRLFDDAAAAARRAEDAADDETKVAGSGSGADTIVDLPRLRAEATAEAESVAAGRLQSLAVTLDKTRVLAESTSSGSRIGIRIRIRRRVRLRGERPAAARGVDGRGGDDPSRRRPRQNR